MRPRDRGPEGAASALPRVRAYLLLRRWLNHFFSVVQGVHGGLWLGLLDPPDLRELTSLHYASTHTRYSREAYNRSGFMPWEAAAFDEHFGDCRSILVGSAGGGREVLALPRRCSRIDAFECSPQLVECCRTLVESRGAHVRVMRAAPDEVPEGAGTYDGAILGWGAYTLIVGRERRIRLLRQFHRRLAPGGPLLLSFFTRTGSVTQGLTHRIAVPLRALRGTVEVEPGDSITTRHEHHFTEEEIRQELAEGGFETVLYSGEGNPHAVGRALPAGGRPGAVNPEADPAQPVASTRSEDAAAGNPGTAPADPGDTASLRTRAYLFSYRWLSRLLKVPEAAHVGFWLGLLDRDELQALTELHYASPEKRYYRAAYNLSGLEPWEAAAFEACFTDCRSILVGSAGGGREVLALSRRGCRVEAFESSPQLFSHCESFLRSQDAAARILPAAPDEVPEDLDTYDGAILGWSAYLHIVGRRRRIRLLEQLHRHIRPGGPLLISFNTRTDSIYDRLSDRIATLIRLLRGAEPAEPGDWITTWYGHYFTQEEIRQELGEGGFEMILFSEEGSPHAVGRVLPADDRR